MNYMPNGHWLALGYEYLTNAQLKRKLDSNGVASSGVTYTGAIYNEHILEYDPVAAKVVWDWSAANHMSTSTDIRKIDVNKFSSGSSGPGGGGGSSGALIHLNSVAYDPEHDLIVVSAHMMDEVFVVDHSVTDTKSSTGGTYKHGGDILFRWGNASNYGGGSSAVFNVVHGANFVPSGYANAGNILAFSNNDNGVYVSGAKGYSMSYEIQPTLEDTGFLIAGSGEFASSVAFDYYNTATKYQSTSDFGFVQRLSNGNTFISFSQGNTLAEVDAGGTIVQEYDNCSNSQVRASRFPYCYEGVSRLAAYASHNCSGASSLKDASGGDVFSMRTSHEDRTLNLRGLDAGTLVRVVDLQGRVRAERTSTATEMAIPMRGWSNGTYLVQLTRDGKTSTKGLGILF